MWVYKSAFYLRTNGFGNWSLFFPSRNSSHSTGTWLGTEGGTPGPRSHPCPRGKTRCLPPRPTQLSPTRARGSGGEGDAGLRRAPLPLAATRRRSCSHAWPVQLFLTGTPFWVSAPRTPLLHLPLLWMHNISGPGASCTAWPVNSYRRSRGLAGGGSDSLSAATVKIRLHS